MNRNLRSIIAKDEAKNRQLQIKLENKFNPISQSFVLPIVLHAEIILDSIKRSMDL